MAGCLTTIDVEIADYHRRKEIRLMFMRAVHPGQILKDELEELSITPTVFSRQIEVPPNRVSQMGSAAGRC